jgi:hypothetical protein
VCDSRRATLDCILDLLNIYRHYSELQEITAPSLISTNHHSTCQVFLTAASSPADPWQRLLTVEILQFHALKSSRDSLSSRTLVNSFKLTIAPSLRILSCRAQMHYPQLSIISRDSVPQSSLFIYLKHNSETGLSPSSGKLLDGLLLFLTLRPWKRKQYVPSEHHSSVIILN